MKLPPDMTHYRLVLTRARHDLNKNFDSAGIMLFLTAALMLLAAVVIFANR